MGVHYDNKKGKWRCEKQHRLLVHVNPSGRVRTFHETQKEAREQLQALETEIRYLEGRERLGDRVVEAIKGEVRSPSFDEHAAAWIEVVRVDLKPTTIDSYERHLRLYLRPAFGHLPLGSLGLAEIEGLLARLQAKHKATGVRRILATLSACLQCAVRWGRIPDNPVRRARKPKVREEDAFVPAVLTPEQANSLLGAAEPDWRTWFLMAVRTGLRSGELRRLTWADMDLEGGVLTVRKSKSGKPRRVPLTDDALDALRRHPRTLGTDLVLQAYGHTPTDHNVRNALHRACKAAGLPPIRPHDLRHTWASHLTDLGVPPEVLRMLGGWSSLQMVQRYGHAGEEAMRDAIRRLGA